MVFVATFQVIGAGELALDVTPTTPGPVTLTGLGTVDWEFSIRNNEASVMTLTGFTIAKSGAAADKILALMLDDIMTIQPGDTRNNKVTIESNQQFVAGDSVSISITCNV